MTLKSRIEKEWTRVAELGREHRQQLEWDVGGGRLRCEMTSVDALACAFECFELQTNRLDDADANQLTQVAEQLSERVSYLLEPIRPIEIDKESCVVQMRSLPPRKNDDGTTYYELVVRHGAVQLNRYHKVPREVRQVVPATVTREVFVRLADDFVAATDA